MKTRGRTIVRDDARPVLEAIAFGDDPRISPADRLRALELLRDVAPIESNLIPREVAAMSNVMLDETLDALLGPEIVASALDDSGWPVMGSLIREAVEARARELVAGRVRRS